MSRSRIHAALMATSLAALPAGLAAAGLDVVNESQASLAWQPTGPVPPLAWPAGEPGRHACVHLGYSINRDGTPSNFIVLRAWGAGLPDGAGGQARLKPFAQSAAANVQARRFSPTLANRGARPLFTGTILVFAPDPGGDLAALRSRCEVGDLRSFILREQAKAQRRGNLNRGIMERNREANPPMIPDGATRHPGWID